MSYKVLQVHTLPLLYGSGQAVILMMQGLRDAGFEVALACGQGPGPLPDRARELGFKVHIIPSLQRPISISKDVKAVLELAKVIRAEGYHIVHTNNSKAGIIGRFAARLAGAPIVVHTIRGYTALYGHSFFKKIFFYILKKAASMMSDKLICISESVRDWALSLHLTNPRKFEVIYSAIDEQRFLQAQNKANCSSVRQRFNIPTDKKIVAQISKLWRGKGLEFLVDVAAKILEKRNDLIFLIVGEGELYTLLSQKILKYEIADSVRLLGYVEDIENLLPCVDIGVLLSEFEGMGRVILEYMISGLPIIATNVGGIPELVINGENGFLIEPNDAISFIERLELLLDDRQLSKKMGQRSRELFNEKFSASLMNERIVQIYRELLKQKGLV